jgi:putative ABC transport system ATP-binding protein
VRPALVEVRGLAHHFGEGEAKKQVLFDNNLDLYRGEIVIMTGPSGSGKTTLLTLMGTLRSVQEGSIRIFGEELRGASSENIYSLRRRIGFIFQSHNLFASLTAYQNVSMAAELAGNGAKGVGSLFSRPPRKKTPDPIAQLLERLGLGQRLHYRPQSLSGGQKQRVAIARALVHGPQLILADEPTAALDEESGREVVTLFQEVAKNDGATIIIVTHDNRILDVADRIVNMVDGRIKSDVLVHEAAVICEYLKGFPLFADLTPQKISDVADQLMVEEAAAGDVVIRQGDVGDRFYLIRSGRVEVKIRDEAGERRVAEFGEGDYFGERALMTDEPRNATVIATAPSVFYTLGKDDFRAVLSQSESFQSQIRKALFQRQ